MTQFLLVCQRHRTAVEWRSEPMKPPPPPDQVCPRCIEERSQKPAHLQATGTRTRERIVDIDSADADFLAGVRNPEARRILLERRALDRERIQAEARAAAELDADRPAVIAFDRARPGRERRAAHVRLRGPRWQA